MKKYLLLAIPLLFVGTSFRNIDTSAIQAGETEKIEDAITVLKEINSIAEKRIPPALMKQAEGIIIVPNVIKAGFILGGNHGKGIAMVRQDNGEWSLPSFITISGGSVGFQAGVKSTDVILVFKRKTTLYEMEKNDFTLGADASIAAGPVGRTASASTDVKFEAEILSYSRSRGIFAGVSFEGSVLQVNKKANDSFYFQPDVTTYDIYNNNVEYSDKESIEKLKSALDGVSA